LRRRHARDRHQRGDCRWERVDVLVTIAGATATTGPGCRCDNVSTPCRPATPGDAYRSVWPRGLSKSTTGQGLSLATIQRSDVTSRSWRGCCRLRPCQGQPQTTEHYISDSNSCEESLAVLLQVPALASKP
jgi:hypothetical protein